MITSSKINTFKVVTTMLVVIFAWACNMFFSFPSFNQMFFWSLILVVSLYVCVESICDLVILELIIFITLVEIFWLPWKFCTLEVVCVSTPLARDIIQ
jgi:hypothetical protein